LASARLSIERRIVKLCTKCHVEKPEASFTRSLDRPSGLTSRCIACRSQVTELWRKSRAGYRSQQQRRETREHRAAEQEIVRAEESLYCRENMLARRRENARADRRELVAYLNEYKAAKGCVVCGVADPPYILDFHHVDPSTKEFVLSKANKRSARVDAEIAKCVVICAIHHRMVEMGDVVLDG
jgi:hypothetical protein